MQNSRKRICFASWVFPALFLFFAGLLVFTGCSSAPEAAEGPDPIDVLIEAVISGTVEDTEKAIAACGGMVNGPGVIYSSAIHFRDGVETRMPGAPPVSFAIIRDETEKMRLLLEAGADLLFADGDGWTPCTYAAAYGSLECVRLLVDYDPETFFGWRSDSGETVLHYAAGFNVKEVVEFLLDQNKIDINLEDDDGWTPAYWAYMANEPVLALLEERGGKLGFAGEDVPDSGDLLAGEDNPDPIDVLIEAVISGTVEDTEKAIAACGGMVNGPGVIYSSAIHFRDGVETRMPGAPPVSFAIIRDETEKMRLLLEAGADLLFADGDGWTPCTYAAAYGSLECVRLLVDYDPETFFGWRSDSGETVLHYAAGFNVKEVVEFLLDQNKIDINLEDDDGWTPAYWAYMANEPVLALLEERGGKLGFAGEDVPDSGDLLAGEDNPVFEALMYGSADSLRQALSEYPDLADLPSPGWDKCKNFRGNSVPMRNAPPLAFAVVLQDTEKVRILLDAGADLFREDDDGWTPCIYAAAFGSLDTIRLMLEKDRSGFLSAESENGEMLLHYAAGTNSVDVVRLLLDESGADVNVWDDDGWTPADWACSTDNTAVLSYLESRGGRLSAFSD